jgi:pimeloyl-ACP methyl ester carboxylesterase
LICLKWKADFRTAVSILQHVPSIRMTSIRPLAVIGIAVTTLVAACGSTSGSGPYSAGLVDIGGGRKMQMECAGVGAPTVLLVSGKGNRADTWRTNEADPRNLEATVFHRVARSTRVCAYDRPATVSVDNEPTPGDPVHHPVTAREGVDDLHALLAADAQGPYVIVGHSYGGLIARLYASTYPDSVAGLVLEDALSEGLYAGLTAAQREVIEALNFLPERVYTEASFEQVLAAPPVPRVPMVILTADLPPLSAGDVASGAFPPSVTVEFVDALWSAQIAAQAALGRLFPRASHITDTHSGHYIHIEQPQLVIDAIREVVDAVRGAKAGR